jgi:serine/threonine protein kinase
MRAYVPSHNLSRSYRGGARERAPLVARACAETPQRHGVPSAASVARLAAAGATQAAEPLDGLLCGRFRITKTLADGTFSRIALVEDRLFPHWRRRVAVKVLAAGFREVGRREAAVLALLQGARGLAIPEFFGAHESGPHYVIAMEACGPSLGELVKQSGPLGERDVRRVSSQLVAALAYCGAKRVIHADIKPENVLCARPVLGVDAEVRLIDFGNAIRPSEAVRYYDDFEIQSLGYRAPEVLAGVPFGYAIDMFSLGVVLVEAALGRALLRPARADRGAARAAIEAALGPFPAARFAGARFVVDDLGSAPAPADDGDRRRRHRDAVRRLLRDFPPRQPGDGAFASFAAAMLELDPDHRAAPREALFHPFLADDFPFAAVFRDG